MTRFLFAMTLVATSILTLSGFAAESPTPDRHDNSSISIPDVTDKMIESFRYAQVRTHPGDPSGPKTTEVAQVYLATACYTFIGRVCPMAVAVPVGAPCTCYYPDGAFSGIAR